MHQQLTERLAVSRRFIHVWLQGDQITTADTGHAPAAYPLSDPQSF